MSHPPWKQDVFVSFVEYDQGETFISNLFKRLHQVGIGHFGDDEREGATKNNEAKRLHAIHQLTFAFALVVFSKEYVYSSPCLNELVEIINCQRDPKVVVIPIFYIDRAGVPDKFKEAIRSRKVSWSALAEAGYELKAAKGDESKLIDIIVERLVNEIHSRYSGKDFTFGPFGGEGQNNWDPVVIEKIDEKGIYRKGIHVEYGDFIKSVTFKVHKETDFKPQNNGESFVVQLEKGEYITSFSGYLEKAEDAYNRIKSLTFRTNKRILGPTDKTKLEGGFFSVPSKGGKVMELWVSINDGFLTSIGARVELKSENSRSASVLSVGLIGSKMGSKWDDGNRRTDLRKIIYELDSGGERFIRSIAFEYQKEDGGTWRSETHGVMGGKKKEKPIKMGTGEYLTSISGYFTKDGIKLLNFLTNKKSLFTIGDKGIDERDRFVRLPTGGKIVGFYGWDFGKLRGIGAYFEGQPFAGEEDLEDNKFDGVREIYVMPMPDQSGFRYIKFLFDNGSEEGLERIHGKWTGEVFGEKQVQLKDYPREYLTSISGYVGEDGAIKSLTFYSNRGTRGRYGKEGDGKYFWYPSTGSRITGFYGTNGETLKSIGVYAEPIPYMYPSQILEPFGGSRGEEWDDGVHTNVRGFRVTTGKANEKIESITFMYDDHGVLVEGSPHGRQDVSSGKWIWLDFPYERLTSIGVWTVEDKIIRGLRITTIRGTSTDDVTYPYGQCATDPKRTAEFTIKKKGHKIVGFFGRKGDSHLISIGAHLEEN
ncbi:hypothetical protein ACJRO7_026506 [Eucalyptus globulus]|uniref:TIR domain-containing protein n=1 Tax=Eucalyptus globulus TaxID=34317 RepID=A0ABD3K0Y2_EUCGL